MWFVLLFMLFCRCGAFRKKNKMTLIPSITILLQWPLPAFIIKVSNFADFEQVIIKISHFFDFEQVIQVILSTKLPWEKADA